MTNNQTYSEQVQRKLVNFKATTSREFELLLIANETLDRLNALLWQAHAQFNAGDRYATFSKQTIASVNSYDENLD